jgi:uncharacterized protein YkwD
MIHSRLVPALVIVLAVGGTVVVAFSPAPEPAITQAAANESVTTTTSTPDFAALVESGASHALPPEEIALTEEALARISTTTTTTSTTTTLAAATTTTTQAPASSPKPTSPPTTAAPKPPPAPTTEAGYSSEAESQFASSINSYRQSQGLGLLSRAGSLDSYARSWAKTMADRGDLSHSNLGSLLGSWSSVGENVGVGGSVGAVFDALVGSAGHRANMLGDFTHFGVGAWRDSSGRLWTAHVFAK